MGTPKRTVLTLEERINVLKRLDAGKSCRQVAKQFGVGKTQIQSIKKRKRELTEDYENNSPLNKKREKVSSVYSDVNELTLSWYQDAVKENAFISRTLIQKQAKKYAAQVDKPNFSASNGWLENFIQRNNIVLTGKSSDGVGHSDYAPSQNLKTTEHEQHAYESSEQPAKKQRIPEESPVPECPISVADDKSAVASLLALSQVSTFKKDAGCQTSPLNESKEIEDLQAQLKAYQNRIHDLTKENISMKQKLKPEDQWSCKRSPET